MERGLGGYARLLQHGAAGDVRGGTEASWALLARHPSDLGALASDPRWTAARLEPEPAVGTWTDDFHNVLSVFKWRSAGGGAEFRAPRSAPASP